MSARTHGGAFRASLVARAPAVYRARVADLLSPATPVTVSARLGLRARRRGERITLVATARPVQVGARVVLQRYWRERFDWRSVARSRLDGASRAVFRVRSRGGERFRVLQPRGVGGYGPATSPAVRVRRLG